MQFVKTPLKMDEILCAVRSVLPAGPKEYALHEPQFGRREQELVKECLESGWVSTAGPFIVKFEEELKKFTGAKHAIAMVNGTAALHIALRVSGVRSGDEVLVQDLTFVATANAVTYCGATPHFIDNDETTLGVDPAKLGKYLAETTRLQGDQCFNRHTGRPIRAAIVMHTFGHASDLDALKKVCDEYHIALVEDAAEAMGTLYKGEHVGRRGRTAVLSFNGNKIMTTGGGGALLTEDAALAEEARHLSTTAKRAHAWEFFHDIAGYNYRMPNLNAALGMAQLERLPEFLLKKRALADRYRKSFESVPGVVFFKEPPFSKSNHWLNTILLDADFGMQRDAFLAILHENGIKARPAWTLMHKLPMYADNPRSDVSTAQNLEARLVNLPSSVFL